MMKQVNKQSYFLPYQIRWLNDKSKYKVWEKSRRIGATYVQSYEDVTDCIKYKGYKVWFSSSDKTAAEEYIDYCKQWAEVLNIAAKPLGKRVLNRRDDLKAYVIQFSNGSRIHALSSNPKQFRSKGGKVVLDEFAHHDNPLALWMAAQPCTMWKGQLRILSTHNGQNCEFFEFVEQIKSGELDWSLHTTPIQLAVEEGFVDKIEGRELTQEEREAWIEEQRKDCSKKAFMWQQEYCCEAVDESTAFLPYSLISTCEENDLITDLSQTTGGLYVGMDVGREHHPSVIWVVEQLGLVNYTRHYEVIRETEYYIQEEILFEILKHKNVRRCCIDATGLGGQLAENTQRLYSPSMVEAIKFNPGIKETLAYNLRTNFENKTIYIPSDPEIREDLHSIICGQAANNHVRFDVKKTEEKGHADRFWALALALYAAKDSVGPLKIKTGGRPKMPGICKGFFKRPNMKTYYLGSYQRRRRSR